MEIFVFGSNLAGRHGKGAALHAKLYYSAETGVGEGPTGRAYAIPTKDKKLQVLSLEDIEKSIDKFHRYAITHPQDLFLLTPIGTGLAGYSKKEIWGILQKFHWTDNVVLTSSWVNKE